MADIIRKNSLALDPLYPPGNQYSIDLPRPTALPATSASPAALPRPSLAPPAQPAPSVPLSSRGMVAAPAPTAADISKLQQTAPLRTPLGAPVSAAPTSVTAPARARPALAPTGAAPLPALQGFRAGSQQATSIQQQINDPAYIPPAGGGLITSSTGNAFRINAPAALPVGRVARPGLAANTEKQYAMPQNIGGAIAALSFAKGDELRAARERKMALQERDFTLSRARLGLDQQRFGLEKDKATREKARDNFIVIPGGEEFNPETFQVTKRPSILFDTRTQRPVTLTPDLPGANAPAPANRPADFNDFYSRMISNPNAKNFTREQMLDYYNRTYGK